MIIQNIPAAFYRQQQTNSSDNQMTNSVRGISQNNFMHIAFQSNILQFKGSEKNADSADENKKITDEYLQTFTKPYYGETITRFNKNERKRIIKLSRENNKLVNYLLNEKIINYHKREVPRFNVEEMEQLVKYSKNNHKLVNFLLRERTTEDDQDVPRFNTTNIQQIIGLYHKDTQFVDYLLKEKSFDDNKKGIPRFNTEEIHWLTNEHSKHAGKIEKLAKCKDDKGEPLLEYSEIISVYQSPKREKVLNMLDVKNKNRTNRFSKYFLIDYAKGLVKDSIIDNANNLAQQNKIENFKILLNNDRQTNTFMLLTKNDDTKTYIIFNSDGKEIRRDKVKTQNKSFHDKFYTKDGNLVEYYAKNNETADRKSVKQVTDNKSISYAEYFIPSEIKGKFNIIRETDGKRYKTALAEKTPSGHFIIEKTFDLENGTKVDGVKAKQSYVYIEDPNGQRSTNISIKDEDGKSLLHHKMMYKKIDDNHFISKENSLTYDIQYSEDKVVVKRNDGKKIAVSIGYNYSGTPGIIARQLVPITKNFPGSAYFAIVETDLYKIGKDIDEVGKGEAHYNPDKHLITLSKEECYDKNICTLLHELGHAIDEKRGICKDKKLLSTYKEERKNLLQNGSLNEFEDMEYFVSLDHPNEDGAITEMIAETNAILSSTNWDIDLEHRGELLQQYFPKSFARIAELLQAK